MGLPFDAWLWISSEKIWLRENVTWNDVESMPGYPKGRDLYYALLVAVVITILRCVLERFVFLPLGYALGLCKSCMVQPNSTLERAFRENTIEDMQLLMLSRKLDWPIYKIEGWLRRRRKHHKLMKKFTEGLWRLTFYGFAVVYGLLTVWGKSWVTNIADCFPHSLTEQVVTRQITWYYLIELGFYLSLSFSLLYDVRRKDFKMMIIHHAITISMFTISWLANVIYLCCLVTICHDVVDVPLEAYKLLKYLKQETLALVAIFAFLPIWFTSRLGYLPFIVYESAKHSRRYLSPFCYYTLLGLTFGLLSLHLMWTAIIVKSVWLAVMGKKGRDIRSDDESYSGDEGDSKTK